MKIAKINFMSKTYSFDSSPSPRVEELPAVPATELKKSTADVLNEVGAGKVFAITRHDKPRAVILSAEKYDALVASESGWFQNLFKQYEHMLDDMQSPEQKVAARRLFEATPEELGEAALQATRKRKSKKK